MSWLFSQALVEASLADISLDGEPSAPLSGSPTQLAYLPPDRMTDFSRPSRSGMTFKPLTDYLGAAVLTWCLEASRARTSAWPAKAQALTESAPACGDTWRGSLARFDPATSSWRTAQPSLLEDLGESSVIWPRSGMTAAGQCWELPMLGRRTDATDSGLWPTPKVCGNYNRKGASASSGDGLATAVYQTPVSRMWKDNGKSPSELDRNSPTLAMQAGGALNPTWVEWLMGWPLGWTDLKRLETDKSHSAPQPLGTS